MCGKVQNKRANNPPTRHTKNKVWENGGWGFKKYAGYF